MLRSIRAGCAELQCALCCSGVPVDRLKDVFVRVLATLSGVSSFKCLGSGTPGVSTPASGARPRSDVIQTASATRKHRVQQVGGLQEQCSVRWLRENHGERMRHVILEFKASSDD